MAMCPSAILVTTIFLSISLVSNTLKAQQIIIPTIITNQTEIYNASNNTGYANNSILCTKQDCEIICEYEYGCANVRVDAHLSNTLTLRCLSEYSCQHLMIISDAKVSTDINCLYQYSCVYSHFIIQNSAELSLHCDTIPGTPDCTNPPSVAHWGSRCYVYYKAACYNTNLTLSQSSNVTINCEYYGCYEMNIFAENITNELTVNCNDQHSCSYIDIFTDKMINELSIICKNSSSCRYANIYAQRIGDNGLDIICNGSERSCYSMNVYCPSENKCNITCSDTLFTCSSMNIFVYDETSDLNLNCKGDSADCDSSVIYCNYTESKALSSNLLLNNFGISCLTEGCCPFYNGNLNCSESSQQQTECIIDCATKNCRNYMIDGSNAMTSFNVNCTGYQVCSGATIRCPTIESVECNIYCQGAYSCQGIVIRGENTDLLDLKCSGNESCSRSDIYCPYKQTNGCNIDCIANDYQLCQDMNIKVDPNFIYNYLNINCNSGICTNYNIGFQCLNTKTDTTLISQYNCNNNEISYCCPWYKTIECDDISSSLCNINCTSSNSEYECQGAVIGVIGHDPTSLTLICQNSQCIDSDIYCPSDSCYIDCSDQFECENLNIYANNTKSLQIECGRCIDINIYANYAGSIILDVTAYDTRNHGRYKPFGNLMGNLYASYAGSIEISCWSHSRYTGCFGTNYYLPAYGNNTIINCYGNGCKNFGNIHIENTISLLNIYINGCNQCDNTSDCIDIWTILCGDSSSTAQNATFSGSDCYPSSHCSCSSLMQSVIFDANIYETNCKYMAIQEPQFSDSAIIAIIIGLVLGGCCFIALCIYCQYKIRRYYVEYHATENPNKLDISTGADTEMQPTPSIQGYNYK